MAVVVNDTVGEQQPDVQLSRLSEQLAVALQAIERAERCLEAPGSAQARWDWLRSELLAVHAAFERAADCLRVDTHFYRLR
jgi:hypothetical protein